MKIELNFPYKSLQPFVADELPDFLVITGKNGTGKTHLLSAISEASENKIRKDHIAVSPEVQRIQLEGLDSVNVTGISNTNWLAVVSSFESHLDIIDQNIEAWGYLNANNLLDKAFNTDREGLVTDEETYKEILTMLQHRRGKRQVLLSDEYMKLPFIFEQTILNEVKDPSIRKTLDIIREIAAQTNQPLASLKKEDIYNFPLLEHWIDTNDLFKSRIEMIFYAYAKRRRDNNLQFFNKKENNEKNNSTSDVEFINDYKAPWDIINNILSQHNLDFAFREIKRDQFVPELTINPTLYKISTDTEISFNSLSSGEKIIISLIIKIFTDKYYEALEFSYPDLILLDEPDSYLHPEMSKLLLDVIRLTFVQKLGIKVIITTHSPSTVALSPEDSIYEMRNGINTGIIKITKDNALKLLTDFIPTLSIDYKNHRQVFTESPRDRAYYQELFTIHSQNKPMHHPLYFLSNNNGNGNCVEVKNMATSFRNSDNNNVFGIIDWDLTNESADNLFVHTGRYSLENFVCDPIYLVTVLFNLKNGPEIIKEFGLSSSFNPRALEYLTDKIELQQIANRFFEMYNKRYAGSAFNMDDTIIVRYLNRVELRYPRQFLEIKGHVLINKIYSLYPDLSLKYQKETDLILALSKAMVNLYPLIPVESIQLIEKLGLPK